MTTNSDALDNRLHFIFENMPDIVWVFNVEKNKFTYVSPAVEKVLGYTREEALMLGFEKWMPVASINKVGELLSKGIPEFAATGKFSGIQDLEVFHKNGTKIWVEMATQFIINPDTGAVEVVGSSRDITKYKEAEKEVLRTKLVMDKSEQLAKLGVWESKAGSHTFKASEEWLNIHGVSKDEFEGTIEQFLDLVHPEDLADVRHKVEQSIENGVTPRMQYRILRPDGQVRHVVTSGGGAQGQEGESDYAFGFTQDITDRVESEMQLRESEENYRGVLENMPIAFFTFDKEGVILSWNKAAEEMYGFTKEEVVGKKSYDLMVTPDTYEATKKLVEKVFEGESFFDNEWRDKDKNGNVGWRFGNAFPRVDSNGEVLYGVNMNTDITDRKKAEEELRNNKKNLELLVKQRTSELESVNESLVEQKQRLECALRELKEAQAHVVQSEKMASVGVLAAGVAHEINNPLNYIQGYISAIDVYFEDCGKEHLEELRPLMKVVKDGVSRAAAIVKSLNKFSRPDGDSLVPCDVNEIFDRCLAMIKNELGERISVVKNYTEEYHLVRGSEGKLHQVLINLLINACQSIENNGEVVLTTEVKNNKVWVSVKDSGCGIEHENLSKILDPFYTTKPPGEGTGLGLYVTNRLVEDHNGKLVIENHPEGGVLATAILPLNN